MREKLDIDNYGYMEPKATWLKKRPSALWEVCSLDDP